MSSGIHLNTTFPGYKFNSTKTINFANNIIIRSGCSKDTWDSEYGAVDMTGSVTNVTFDNTYIYEAQHDGVRIGDQVNNVITPPCPMRVQQLCALVVIRISLSTD